MSILNKWADAALLQSRPMQATLELTNQCNERCGHCYIPSYEDDTNRLLTLEQWVQILDQLKEAGTLNLIFMGGEPLLSPIFWKLAKSAASKGFFLSTISNGLLLSDRLAEKLSKIGFSNVTISLYSLDPAIHDKMTNLKGSHKRTLQAIDNCLKYGVPVGVNCLLTKDNIEGIIDLKHWGIDKGIDVKYDPTVTPKLDHDKSPTLLRASPEQLDATYKRLADAFGRGLPAAASPDDFICNAAKGKCAITSYGELLPCVEIRDVLGDLKQTSFKDAWASDAAIKWRSLKMSKLLTQADGSTVSLCDHCPGMALHESEDELKISDFSRALAKIKHKHFNPVQKP
jgi:MoaA/NifB/PqqE/SkfB family radical SAM enzyme